MRRSSGRVRHTKTTPAATSTRRKAQPHRSAPSASPSGGPAFPIVGIGASAGGLDACKQLLRHLPADTGMAFVLVQHLDPKHESILSELLSKETRMPVSQVHDGLAVEPNHVYVMPPNVNITIAQGVLRLLPREIREQHLPIDHFLRALAVDQASNAIGVILSGTASDGALGLQAIKAEGGISIVQDERSAKYDGMPRSAIAAGPVDFVLPPNRIARELAKLSRHPYVAQPSEAAGQELLPEGQDEGDLDRIYGLLRAASHVEFTYYRQTTLKRRLMRRMVLHKIHSLKKYVTYLQSDPAEVKALSEDFLISVTRFFREAETLSELKRRVFSDLVKDGSRSIRAWVPGCSTGEEAYSLAICLLEFLGDRAMNVQIQIFASDVNERLIQKARSGIYPDSIAADVSPERLERFFEKVDGNYQVSKRIRDLCIFSKHDVTRDPPFSRMDLISCCNLLIYLEPPLQKKVLRTYHYALVPGGTLVLGHAESIGTLLDLFAPLDKKRKIYTKQKASSRLPLTFDVTGQATQVAPAAGKGKAGQDLWRGLGAEEILQDAERVVLQKYVPASVIVNDQMEILRFNGSTGPYLEPAPGEASFNVMRMVREGLGLGLRTAIHKARKKGASVRVEGLEVRHNGHPMAVNLEVIPLKARVSRERFFLVLFEEAARAAAATPATSKEKRHRGSRGAGKVGAAAQQTERRQVVRLKRELSEVRDYLQSIIGDQEASNEELKSANEEILSSNEELQSTNEELETAQEELQSTNEELNTVNDELRNRNAEVSQANNDLTNLLESTTLPVVMLGADLRIRRFTPMAGKTLNLIATDVGRPIGDIKPTLTVLDFDRSVMNVIETGTPLVREVQDTSGRWYSMIVRPYKAGGNRIEGAVLVLVDIDASKRSSNEIKAARDYAEAIVETVREPLIILDSDLNVKTANMSFYETFRVIPEETEGRFIYDLGNRQWDTPALRTLLGGALIENSRLEGFEVTYEFTGLGRRTMMLNARRIYGENARDPLILLAIEDVTERALADEERSRLLGREREARAEAERANRAKNEFLAMLSHELRTPLNVMLGWIWRLRHGILDELTVTRALEIIERNTRLQAQLVEDLLDVSSVEAGKLRVDQIPVDLAAVAEAAVEAVRPMAETKGIRLEASLDVVAGSVLGDPGRLQQVVWNLLTNAIKFTATGGRVEVRLERVDAVAQIRVSDTGAGISPQFLPHIFEPFRQAASMEGQERGGLGLGLSIVRRLVELHGGTVQAESPGEGKGTTITVTLPIRVTRLDSRHPEGAEAMERSMPALTLGRLDGLRVLVVDDEADARESLAMVLEQHGASVTAVGSVAEALDALARLSPDVLVSDIKMPGEDGYALIREVRARQAGGGRQIPALALTAYARVEDRVRLFSAGYQTHMPKPADPTELVGVIANLAARV